MFMVKATCTGILLQPPSKIVNYQAYKIIVLVQNTTYTEIYIVFTLMFLRCHGFRFVRQAV